MSESSLISHENRKFVVFCKVQLVLDCWRLILDLSCIVRELFESRVTAPKITTAIFLPTKQHLIEVARTNEGPLIAFDVLDAAQYIEAIKELRFCAVFGSQIRIWVDSDSTEKPRPPEEIELENNDTIITMSIGGCDRMLWVKTEPMTSFVLDAFGFEYPIHDEDVPSSKSSFKNCNAYILESQTKHRYVLRQGARPIGYFNGKDKIYCRSDCYRLRSWRSWLLQNRRVVRGQAPTALRGRGSSISKLFTYAQTEPVSFTLYPRLVTTSSTCSPGCLKKIESNLEENEIEYKRLQRYLFAKTSEGFAVYLGHFDAFSMVVGDMEEKKRSKAEAIPRDQILRDWKLLITRILVRRYLHDVVYNAS